MTLDCIDAGRDPADHSRRVARARTYFQHPIAGLQLGSLDHQRDHVGLGDGLVRANRQWAIVVGKLLEAGVDELFAGNLPKGLKDTGVADSPAGDLNVHHSFASTSVVRHEASTPAPPRSVSVHGLDCSRRRARSSPNWGSCLGYAVSFRSYGSPASRRCT